MRTLLLLLITLSLNGFSQIPAGYYDSAAGLSGNDLKQALHEIIDNHDDQSYSELHTHYEETDKKSNGKVWDMYSDNPGGTPPYEYSFTSGDQCGSYNSEADCYNREHSWPKSWFGGEVLPMYTDLFLVYPTDGYVNGMRSSHPYGEVGSASWTSMNGSKVGSCNFPGYSGTVFEPIDEYKGDFARSYFYMTVRYLDEDSGWPGSDMTDGAQLETWAVELLKKWHFEDPVSTKETDRNNAVYLIQDNRNPFIDHPEYVDSIYGSYLDVSENIIENQFKVYCSDMTVWVENNSTLSTSMSIYDTSGRILIEMNLEENTSESVILEEKGIVIVVLKNEKGIMTEKLVVL